MKRIPMMIAALTLAIVVAGAVAPASAQPGPNRVARREWRQAQRIRSGVCSGQLTRRETRRLYANQRQIRRMELRARADGRLCPYECRRLDRALDRQSARIWRLRHNGRAI